MNIVARLTSAAVAASLAFAMPASAQITFTGYTTGCFYSVGSCTPGSSASIGSLSFNGGTFATTTAGGFGAIGNSLLNNFGTFSLPATTTPANFTSTPANFLLYITFTTPVGIAPNPLQYTAALEGVLETNTGGVTLNFGNLNQAFSFTGGTGTLKLNDVSITNNSGATSVPISGDFRVTATTVPEPGTYLLMASGLAGLGVMARRRRNNA